MKRYGFLILVSAGTVLLFGHFIYTPLWSGIDFLGFEPEATVPSPPEFPSSPILEEVPERIEVAGSRLSVVVTDTKGVGLAGVVVESRSKEDLLFGRSFTGADGRALVAIPDAPVDGVVLARAPGYFGNSMPFSHPGKPLSISLEAACRGALSLIRADDGSPWRGRCRIWVLGLSAWNPQLGLAAPAEYFAVPEELHGDGEGWVRFGVPRGDWIGVLVQPEQGLIATKVVVREEILAGGGSIPIVAGGGVDLQVRTPRGAVVEHHPVEFFLEPPQDPLFRQIAARIWPAASGGSSRLHVATLRSDRRGRIHVPWAAPGIAFLRPRGTTRPWVESRLDLLLKREPPVVLFDPGEAVSIGIEGLPWDVASVAVRLHDTLGGIGGSIPARLERGRFLCDGVPAGVWRIVARVQAGSVGGWELPLSPDRFQIGSSPGPIALKCAYQGPTLAGVGGVVAFAPQASARASLELQGETGSWRAPIDREGKITPIQVPVGVYQVLFVQPYSVVLLGQAIQVPLCGLTLEREVAFARVELILETSDGETPGRIQAAMAARDGRGRIVHRQSIDCREGVIRFLGDPWLEFIVSLNGPLPGARTEVVVQPRGRSVVFEKVVLPWRTR